MKPSSFAMTVFKKRFGKKPSDDDMDIDMSDDESEQEEETDVGCEAAVKRFFEAGSAGDYTKAARFLKKAIELA